MPSSTAFTLPPLPLPPNVRSRIVDTSPHALSFHILESGFPASESPEKRPLIVLLHGYPELAFSWRKVLPLLADHGYHVVALDQRGYGRTTGWDTRPFNTVDLHEFSIVNLVRDVVVLVNALGHHKVRCVAGHDFGAVSASLCALTRPDFFENLAIMSHPFKGSPILPFDTANESGSASGKSKTDNKKEDIRTTLANLDRPRKHYKWDNSTPTAAAEWLHPTESLKPFLRGYFHLKSADWAGNDPHTLSAWSATELAKMPRYYIMDAADSMRQAVSRDMESESTPPEKLNPKWLTDEELDVYVSEHSRTGFQGSLNWYRVMTDPAKYQREMDMFAGKKLEVPTVCIGGKKDWGMYQEPGAVERLKDVCAEGKFRGTVFVEDAGHWVTQEKPEVVVEVMIGLIGGKTF